jgi:predicted ATPase
MISPEQQKQRTLQTLLTILLRIAAQQPVFFVMEDLHWVDPSTLELPSLLVDQGPTARILALLTYRPDFSPPWVGRSHVTQVTVHRLPRPQAVEVINQVAHGKALPRPRYCLPPAGEVARAAGGDEPGTAVAAAGQACGSLPDAR